MEHNPHIKDEKKSSQESNNSRPSK
jgi:hypothetical protein